MAGAWQIVGGGGGERKTLTSAAEVGIDVWFQSSLAGGVEESSHAKALLGAPQ